jgi:hypothetical protein
MVQELGYVNENDASLYTPAVVTVSCGFDEVDDAGVEVDEEEPIEEVGVVLVAVTPGPVGAAALFPKNTAITMMTMTTITMAAINIFRRFISIF